MEEENNAVTEWSKFDYQDVVLGNISVVSFAERERERERERGGLFQFVLITFSNAGK